MAGVDIDCSANPWKITYNGAGGTALPAKIWPQNISGEIAPNMAQRVVPFMPRRIRWVAKSAAQDNGVILKDLPPSGSAHTIFEEYAPGADFSIEHKPRGKELFMGCQVTQMDVGTLFIYL